MRYNKNNPLRVVTLCSGYDSQCLALNRLRDEYPEFDYDLVAWAEFDPESNQPLERQPAVIAHNALFPQYADRNMGDMTKIDWEKLPDFDLLFASTPCFVAGTLVLTSEGYKPIEKIQVGDYVLTKSNVMHKVLNTFDNGVHPTCVLHGYGFHEIHTTPSHKFWARRRFYKGHYRVRTFTEPEFIEAKDLTSDHYLGFPVNEESIPFITEDLDFWYLMGMYIGDGWVSKRDNVVLIACNDKKLELLKNALSKDKWKWSVQKGRTCNRVSICSKELKKTILEHFGSGCKEKRIPFDVIRMPREQLQQFFKGYLDSDGCKPKPNYVQFSTANRNIAYATQQIVAKLYHRPMSVYQTKVTPTTTIEGRVVNQSPWYQMRAKTTTDKQDQSFYEDGYIWYPFQDMEPSEPKRVYNIEVEEDHSYIVHGAMVKNCQDISNAGLTKGFEAGSGTRSSIIWNVHDCIRIKHPKYIIMENVSNILSKKFYPKLMVWLNELEKMGYKNFVAPSFETPWKEKSKKTKAGTLNSCDYGIAQNRVRWFGVSIFREGIDPQYYFPKPFKLDQCLNDVLEENVDESFFLSEEMLARFCEKSIQENDGV